MGRSTSHIPSAPREGGDAVSDYPLYYWWVPFRGQIVRAVLSYAVKSWIEMGDTAISELMDGPVADNPVPFMGPPVLTDRKAGFAIAQMPAIILYLGETLSPLPATAASPALSMKIVNDANDVIDEITLDGGREMWTRERREDFVPRLKKWMSCWEETGCHHGLKAGSRLPAWRRCPRRCRHRDGHLMVNPGRSFRRHRGDPAGDRPHDDGSYPKDRGNAANGQARRKGPRKIRRRLLRWPDRSLSAQGARSLNARHVPSFAT